jgi:serine protease Do
MTIIKLAAGIGLALAFCSPHGVAGPVQIKSPSAGASLQDFSGSLEMLADQVNRSVVQILTSGLAPAGMAEPGVVASQRGTGSGVVVDDRGYIVTNAHVVEAAQRVQVLFPVTREDRLKWRSILKPRGSLLEATIVGIDTETDLAVLKVEGSGFSALELGDSDALRQGQVVLAFGSPFGLDNSVSMGVVSAVARQLRPDDPMIYIQTDASINPGNSGGPLVNTVGQVVGINTMIYSKSGGSEGLGFAAPSNIVGNVFRQIQASGRVRRGHIGVSAQSITPALAAGLRLPRGWGVILGDVESGGPAELAGLKVGDIVLSVDGKPMENARQLEVSIYRRSIGETVSVEVQRGEDNLVRALTVRERPNDPYRFSDLVSKEANLVQSIGVFALEVDERISALLPPLRKPAGLIVAGRLAEHPADGLRPGDLIIALNGSPVRELAGFRSALQGLSRASPVVLQIQRQGTLMFVALELP